MQRWGTVFGDFTSLCSTCHAVKSSDDHLRLNRAFVAAVTRVPEAASLSPLVFPEAAEGHGSSPILFKPKTSSSRKETTTLG